MCRWLTRHYRAALAAALVAGLVVLVTLGAYTVVARRHPEVLLAPTGTAQVGRMQVDWVDTSRTDPPAGQPNAPRRLPIWIWYPASVTDGATPAPVLPPAWRRAQSSREGLVNRVADFVLSPLVKRPPTRSHAYSYRDAPPAPAAGGYPVLLMQPGMGQSIPDYTVYAENLASHGYVVVGINEPGSSTLVVFADGRVVKATPAGSIADNAGPAETERRKDALGPVWTADALFVLNQLQLLNADAASPWYRQLDLSRVGLFGHSFGGASALAVCQQDARCRAGVDLDGTPISASLRQPLSRPFLFLTEGYPRGCAAEPTCRPIWQAYQQAVGPAALVAIDGAAHSNFSDVDLQFTGLGRLILQRFGVVGSISPERGLAISNANLVAFFDRYLMGAGGPQTPPNLPAFPGVQIVSKP